MPDHAIQTYLAEAVAFCPGALPARPLRVAATPLTCEVAVAVLNALAVPAESGSTYRYINVHNPSCPLLFDAALEAWLCDPALAQHPVWNINWAGADMICRYLGGRLPFVREWECFASNNQPQRSYPWGEAPPSDHHANFGEHVGGTTPVHHYPPSELGLYDLAGNLSEWCQDSLQVDGKQMVFEKVVKGGAWSKDASHLRIHANRGKWERLGTTTIGLRPVWDV